MGYNEQRILLLLVFVVLIFTNPARGKYRLKGFIAFLLLVLGTDFLMLWSWWTGDEPYYGKLFFLQQVQVSCLGRWAMAMVVHASAHAFSAAVTLVFHLVWRGGQPYGEKVKKELEEYLDNTWYWLSRMIEGILALELVISASDPTRFLIVLVLFLVHGFIFLEYSKR